MILVITIFCASFGLPSTTLGNKVENLKKFAVCDRINTTGVCEEYHLDSLSLENKRFAMKYCIVGKRCPTENRVGRCINFQGPDGLIFDQHYYSGTAKGYNWKPSSIKVTCKTVGGQYEES